MKSCPACNRTFEDTLTYCLIDGSILSAPFDPQRTEQIPDARRTDPAPTEVWRPAPPPQFTVPAQQPPPVYPPLQGGQMYPTGRPPVKRSSFIKWLPLVFLILWIITTLLGIGGFLHHIFLLAAIVILIVNLVRR